jgi:hypothetical protein
LEERRDIDDAARDRIRRRVHVGFALVLLWVILTLRAYRGGTVPVIDLVMGMASYTYGPLLGLFVLGLGTRARVGGPWLPVVCVAAPLACGWVASNSAAWLGGYRFGTELLLANAFLTALGLVALARTRGPA